MKRSIIYILAIIIITVTWLFIWKSCSQPTVEKGFAVSESDNSQNANNEHALGIINDSMPFETQPSNVVLTGVPHIRLTTVYKVNFNLRDSSRFISNNNYLYREQPLRELGNNWNGNIMPGFEGIYGFNLVNVSHFNFNTNSQHLLFKKPVLIKTLYYPSFTIDTLNNKPVKRNVIMVSAYNEDTNKDGYINLNDLRRFYLFSINGELLKPLIPENYSVFKSEYDPENDFMFVFARLDQNNNGQIEDQEPVNIFGINLNDPTQSGKQY